MSKLVTSQLLFKTIGKQLVLDALEYSASGTFDLLCCACLDKPDYGHPIKAKNPSKKFLELFPNFFGAMWQTKYTSAIRKNLGVGVDFRPCSEDDFLTGHL